MKGLEFTVKAYKGFLEKGKIMGSQCRKCGVIYLPPRPVCPRCSGDDIEWAEINGEGVIQAYTVIYVPLTRFKNIAPYTVILVKLDEGPTISGMIIDIKDGDEISIGSRVKAEFQKKVDKTLLHFRLL